MAKSRKRKPAQKPAYTKLEGYRHVHDIVRKAPRFMADSAKIAVQFTQLEPGTLTPGEILSGNDAIKKISSQAQQVKDLFVELETGFNALIAKPGKRVDEDFTDLVGLSMEFMSLLVEAVIAPMADIAEIVEKRLATKEEKTCD